MPPPAPTKPSVTVLPLIVQLLTCKVPTLSIPPPSLTAWLPVTTQFVTVRLVVSGDPKLLRPPPERPLLLLMIQLVTVTVATWPKDPWFWMAPPSIKLVLPVRVQLTAVSFALPFPVTVELL